MIREDADVGEVRVDVAGALIDVGYAIAQCKHGLLDAAKINTVYGRNVVDSLQRALDALGRVALTLQDE